MLFIPGNIYNRKKDIHQVYSGQEQGGISTPAKHNLIFLFTSESGKNYGYDTHDGWKDSLFYLTGEGQVGNQEYNKGNKAVRDHISLQKDLHLFAYKGMKKGFVRYVGQMVCSGAEISTAPDINKVEREVIVFKLAPIEVFDDYQNIDVPDLSFGDLRRKLLNKDDIKGRVFERSTVYHERSKYVREYALMRAKGICEACEKPAPFAGRDNAPFLEVHHLNRLSDGGPDSYDMVAAICPNCHRRVHFSSDGDSYNESLSKKIKELEISLNSRI